jgi:hypothetical protein
MRAWPIAAVLIILVVGVAVGAVVVCTQTFSRQPIASRADAGQSNPVAPADKRKPKLVVEQEEFQFGRTETNSSGHHDFRLTNAGTGALVLRQGKSTCGCCTCVCKTQLPDEGKILPGASAAATLKWTIKRFTGAYHQSSTILTNDPDRPEVTLAVSGRIVPTVRVVPWQLVFSSVLVGQKATSEVRVYGYRSEPLKIVDYRLSDPSTSQYFETTIDALSADQVAEEKDARSGFLIRVILKSGLPLGPFRQQIILNTNLDSARTIEVPIEGRIANYISVVGRGWDSQAGVLNLPVVASSKGVVRSLMLVVRGTHSTQTKFKLARIVPECLEVKLGETTAINKGASARTPLTIRIPAGSSLGNYLGPPQGKVGQVIIDTNHPQQPQLRIPVSFVIKN